MLAHRFVQLKDLFRASRAPGVSLRSLTCKRLHVLRILKLFDFSLNGYYHLDYKFEAENSKSLANTIEKARMKHLNEMTHTVAIMKC